MNARHTASLVVLAWSLIGPRSFATAPATRPAVGLNPAIRDLFDQLAADDPKEREEATQRLANYGDVIRPALLEAARHGEPAELRFRTARVLCVLSWVHPDDPPAARQVLSDYRSADPAVRMGAAARLGAIGDAGFPVLLRLLDEEPSVDVRWVIAKHLRYDYGGEAQRARLRQLDTTAAAEDDDAPVLATAGWAWLATDAARGEALLRRATDAAVRHPCGDASELQGMITTLYARALNAGDYDDAAAQLRRLVWHGAKPPGEAVLDLFALHAQHGPLRGFDADLRLARDSFYSPEMMYLVGRMYAHHDQPLLATAFYRAAGLSAVSTQLTHKRLAEFLLTRQWYDLAQAEYEWVLATGGPEKAVHDADAYVGLSRCAAGLGDDGKAAELLTIGLHLAGSLPNRQINNERDFRAEIDWHALRAASARHDATEVAQRVDRLLVFNSENPYQNPEIGIDLVTALKSLHRDGEAARVFTHFYARYQDELARDPHEPEVLNNIAWLCARCNEHVEDSVRWSREATRLAPANAAYLDTAAEAAAVQGNWDEAVRLESAALRLQPGDRFMTAQLLRFRDGPSW